MEDHRITTALNNYIHHRVTDCARFKVQGVKAKGCGLRVLGRGVEGDQVDFSNMIQTGSY